MFGITEKEKSVMKTVLNYFGFLIPGDVDLLNRVRARSSKNVYLKVFST